MHSLNNVEHKVEAIVEPFRSPYYIIYYISYLSCFFFFWVEFWLWDGHVVYLFPTFIRDKDPTVNRGFLTKRKTNLVDNVARKKEQMIPLSTYSSIIILRPTQLGYVG